MRSVYITESGWGGAVVVVVVVTGGGGGVDTVGWAGGGRSRPALTASVREARTVAGTT